MSKFDTIHTKLSYYTVVLAIVSQLLLAIPLVLGSNINSEERAWRELAFWVGIISFVSLFFADLFRGYRLKLIKEKYRPLTFNTLIRTVILIVLLLGSQVFSNLFFLSIRGYEVALANIVAAPSEEMIFRGAMISFFMMIGSRANRSSMKTFELEIIFRDAFQEKNRKFSLIEVIGIFMSAIAFAMYHENYYDNIPMLISLTLWGIILGFFYIYWDDLTAVIFSHFLINFVLAFVYLGNNWWKVIL